ncbi:uncharacterized protein KY384_003463 [Bacidia gigantensis]|uniref:uncharacterized protein n=1 Tax=Bacidia gigantensis TaxID=2732470 RepID=UPI001D056F10|nr:uncharacterized protein KY384_003463 [Bacidia gigantensis]KAG8531827.1 hypothetical protein KY384_003463 [Bacidia gigantensis]
MLTVVFGLGLLILLADTWLHVVTETVSISRSLRLTGVGSFDGKIKNFVPNAVDRVQDEEIENAIKYQGTSMSGGYWSTQLAYDCGLEHSAGNIIPCSLGYGINNTNTLKDYGKVNQFLSNSSSTFNPQITQFSNAGINSTMVLIVPADIQQNSDSPLDFTAHTYGASTTCKPVTEQCDMSLSLNYTLAVNCDKAGSTYQQSVGIGNESSPFENHTLHSDPRYTKPIPWNTPYPQDSGGTKYLPTLNMTNPSYPVVAMASVNFNEESDLTIVTENAAGERQFLGMVLFCSHTIWATNYTFLNNSWLVNEAAPADIQVANITNIPLMLGYLQPYFHYRVDDVLATDILDAGLQPNVTTQALADKYALAYSQASMAILSANLRTTPVHSAQIRHNLLVARVPKAPLFCLVVLNFLYAALGLGLTLYALRAVRRDEAVIDVQARLSVAGLTAECFEDGEVVGGKVDASEDLFGEKKGRGGGRIGVRWCSDGEGDGGGGGEDGVESGSDGNEIRLRGRGWRLRRYDVDEGAEIESKEEEKEDAHDRIDLV